MADEESAQRAAELSAFSENLDESLKHASLQCGLCRAAATKKPLSKCSKCKVVHYCCKKCQVDDWPMHKKMCKGLKEVLESHAEDQKLDTIMARMRSEMEAMVTKNKGKTVPEATSSTSAAEKPVSRKVVALDGNPVSEQDDVRALIGEHNVTYDVGDKFEGSFKDGQPHGHGKYTWLDGQTYVGQYVNGKQHGAGKYRNEGGDEFEGSWVDGKRQGRGVSTFASGSRFEGEFQDDKQHGHGTYTWADGDKYVGAWDRSDMHGHGVFTFASGKVFEGSIFHDRPVEGIITETDGRRFKVTYKKGVADIEGAIYDDPPTLTKTLLEA